LVGGCYNTLPSEILNWVLDTRLRIFAENFPFDESELDVPAMG
jgi:hypothetical protein